MVANIAVFADSKFQRLPNVKIFTAHCIFTFPKSFGFFDFFTGFSLPVKGGLGPDSDKILFFFTDFIMPSEK